MTENNTPGIARVVIETIYRSIVKVIVIFFALGCWSLKIGSMLNIWELKESDPFNTLLHACTAIIFAAAISVIGREPFVTAAAMIREWRSGAKSVPPSQPQAQLPSASSPQKKKSPKASQSKSAPKKSDPT